MSAALTPTPDGFLRHGEPHLVISGAIHYFRVHPEQWRDRLRRLVAMGCNTVETYVAWNVHQSAPGETTFEGFADVGRFLDLAAEEGLDAIVRPGPYICAEWENGGFPGWLLADRNLRLRHRDPAYLAHVDAWFDELIPVIAARQAARGGNVVMVQVENEYGSFGDDTAYLAHLRDGLIARGIEELLVTSDGQFRRGKAVEVKSAADEAARDLPDLEYVLVVRRTGQDVAWTEGRDVWWHESVDRASEEHTPEPFDAEHPLFIIYTSGTTGKPKGLVHTSGGYLAHASWSHWAHFDAKESDVHWCTADLAWVTAHTYEIYGPLSNGLTQVIYEGTPGEPHRERHLEIIERYGVTVYYTAPTLIRTLMSWFGEELPSGHDLSTLRLLGTVGEAINPEAWIWFHRTFGRGELPIIDTWWQSETGASMLVPLPGVTTLKPGSATGPLPGIDMAVVDEAGREVPAGVAGTLVARRPWPGMARTVWGDPERYRDSYWRDYAGCGEHGGYYVAGDSATVDADGCFWILGRLDDVVNVSGHRLSTIEIESALVAEGSVQEAGAAGIDDALTGQAVAVFVIPRGDRSPDAAALRDRVAREIGPIAKPRHVIEVPDLPRTRSGKIMRRLLAQLVHTERARRAGRTPGPLGDVTSLQNPEAVASVADVLAALPADDPTVSPQD